MVIRRTVCILADQPPGREDDKVRNGRASDSRVHREHSEDARVWVVVGNSADGVEAPEVVLHRVVVPMPCNYVEGSMLLGRIEEIAIKFARDGVGTRCRPSVICERCHRHLEVAGIGETVRADGTELRELKVPSCERF